MAWDRDLVAELRQLSHDIVNTSPQAEAIKAKHPAILDAAAKEIVALRELVEEQKTLLKAVKSSHYQGVWCDDVAGGNWFDRRDACVALR
jgi:hypothetical protein